MGLGYLVGMRLDESVDLGSGERPGAERSAAGRKQMRAANITCGTPAPPAACRPSSGGVGGTGRVVVPDNLPKASPPCAKDLGGAGQIILLCRDEIILCSGRRRVIELGHRRAVLVARVRIFFAAADRPKYRRLFLPSGETERRVSSGNRSKSLRSPQYTHVVYRKRRPNRFVLYARPCTWGI